MQICDYPKLSAYILYPHYLRCGKMALGETHPTEIEIMGSLVAYPAEQFTLCSSVGSMHSIL